MMEATNFAHDVDELRERLGWLIKLRWLALGGIVISLWIVKELFRLPIPLEELYLTTLGIFCYNSAFYFYHKRLIKSPPATDRPVRRFTYFQVSLDWFVLAIFVHLTGGIESPVLSFFFFHIIITALLLSPRHLYLQPTLGVLLVGTIAGLEYYGTIDHVFLTGFIKSPQYDNPLYIIGVLFFFATALYSLTYFASSIIEKIRDRDRRLRRLNETLQNAAQRMETLYALTRSITSTLDLTEALGLITKNTVEIMKVKGCSVYLLDKTGSRLELSGAYGLSEDYLQKGPVHIDQSLWETKEGMVVEIPDVTRDPLFQHSKEPLKEDNLSMLEVPLKMKEKFIGVLRIHNTFQHKYSEEEKRFFSALGGAVSIAICNALAYRKVLELDASRSRLMLTVAHELRAPVSAIQGILQTLLKGYLGELSDEQKELLSRAETRTHSFVELINDLLDLGTDYLDSTKAQTKTSTSIKDIIERVVTLFDVRAREKNILLRANIPDQVVPITEYRGDMEKLFTNLIGNALKYTPSGGKVDVEIIVERDYLKITVSDTGIGIPAEEMPHIFEEFYRASNAKKSQREGSGLGLAVVKSIIDRYSGQIKLESKINEGTTATVIFPLPFGHTEN